MPIQGDRISSFHLQIPLKVPSRAPANRRLDTSIAACLLAGIVSFGGCMAWPDAGTCTTCSKSLPLHMPHIPLDIPWIGDDSTSTGCGSACESVEGCREACDDCTHDEYSNDTGEPHFDAATVYEQVVDRMFVQTASTVVMSTVSIAGTAFGTVANYCIPEGAIGPPDTTPPGRFHPVPTRPVFAPSMGG